jgi:hypothetical protein
MTTHADDADDGDGRRPGRAAIAGIFQPTPTDRPERRTRHAAARATTAFFFRVLGFRVAAARATTAF